MIRGLLFKRCICNLRVVSNLEDECLAVMLPYLSKLTCDWKGDRSILTGSQDPRSGIVGNEEVEGESTLGGVDCGSTRT